MEIDVKCGIFDTVYRCTKHADGSVTVRAPYVKWDRARTTGTLDFEHIHLHGEDAAAALVFFEADELALEANNVGGSLTLDDVIYGNRAPGVMPVSPR